MDIMDRYPVLTISDDLTLTRLKHVQSKEKLQTILSILKDKDEIIVDPKSM